MNNTRRLELITEAVLYCQKVSKLGMPSNCFTKALREPIFFLWEMRDTTKKHKAAMYRSRNAHNLVAGEGALIYDHAVPFNYLQRELVALDQVSTESVERVLQCHGVACLITKEEDRMLSKAGLGRKMPANWDGKDCLARYRAVDIEILPNPDYHSQQQ